MASLENQAVKITVNGPVEAPGIVLQQGTYWLQLLTSHRNLKVVEIWNSDRTHLVANVLTVADMRMRPAGKTLIKFSERRSNTPQALRAFFYPGDTYGHQFVYPESEAKTIARKSGEPVLAVRDNLAKNVKNRGNGSSVQGLNGAQVKVVRPNGTETTRPAAQGITEQINEVLIFASAPSFQGFGAFLCYLNT